MTQSMTDLFTCNAVSGTVTNINDIEAADQRAIIMDLALRAIYSILPEKDIKQNIHGRGTFSIVRGSVLFSVLDTYQVGVYMAGENMAVCVKGQNDEQWHGIDYTTEAMADAPHYKQAEKLAFQNIQKHHKDFHVGDFILATNEASKESSVIEYLRSFNESLQEGRFAIPCLCHIERIEDLTDEQLDAYDFMCDKPEGFEGGSYSEDVPDDFNGYDYTSLTYAQRRSWIQRVCILRTPSRWVAVDPQGYSYSRYVHFPVRWRQMFAEDVKKAEQKEREYQAYLQAEQDKRDQEQQARYDKRTQRILEATDGLKGIKAIDWDKRGAQARCNNAIKRILKAFFPDTEFSVVKDYEYHSAEVSWTAGPDEKDVRDILEVLEGDAWATDDYDYSRYGGLVIEHRANKVTEQIGQLGRVRTYHRAA